MPEFRVDRDEPVARAWSRDEFYERRRARFGSLKTFIGYSVAVGAVVGAAVATKVSLEDGVNTKEERVTVCDKEYVPDGNGSGEYRVYVADSSGERHTRRVVDTAIVGGTRFDSADFYAGLDRDRTYDITTSGFRVGIASQFPNIIAKDLLPEELQVNYCKL